MSTAWRDPAGKSGAPRSTPRKPNAASDSFQPPVVVIPSAASISSANIRAIETIYYAAMLEEARVFQVVDRLVAMFASGLLPLAKGPSATTLYRRWKSGAAFLNAAQRAALYARAIGLGTPDLGGKTNRRFEPLWLKFLGTVGMYAAEQHALPVQARSVTQEEVRKAGRELAENLTFHGQGIALIAAVDLRKELKEVARLLSDPEITTAFGASDEWRLVEVMAGIGPDGRHNVPRARTRAESGRVIFRWLANHRKLLARPSPAKILKEEQLRERRCTSPEKQRTHPSDYDLVHACEDWLRVTGTEEAIVSADLAEAHA